MAGVGAGIDRNTGKLLSGWDHVVQSILIIMTTAYGQRMDEALAEMADRIEKLGATFRSGRDDPAAVEEEAA